jgi:hypothetical protein
VTLLARLKERLRTPRWLPVALDCPQTLVRVMLVAGGRRFDVTLQNVVAALEPLTLALPGSEELDAALRADDACLEFVDEARRFTLGNLSLMRAGRVRLAGIEAVFFHVRSGSDYCRPWSERVVGRIARAARRAPAASGGLQMSREAIERLLVFYLCPRPVVLVSVCEGREGNLFPMDLIGPFGEGRFTLALRNTSPSVATMKRIRTVVLSDISPLDCQTAYRLGAHHKTAAIAWDTLPFAVHRTAGHDIPYPAIALRVRELALLGHEITGSHTLFMAEIAAEQALSPGPRLFHTTSSHQRYRRRCGTPLQSASLDESWSSRQSVV